MSDSFLYGIDVIALYSWYHWLGMIWNDIIPNSKKNGLSTESNYTNGNDAGISIFLYTGTM